MGIAFCFLAIFQGRAQNSIPPDLSFSLSLGALPDLSSGPSLVTGATYYRTKNNFNGNYFVPQFTQTNIFEMIINGLDTAPSSARIIEKEDQGGFSPVVSITNIFGECG